MTFHGEHGKFVTLNQDLRNDTLEVFIDRVNKLVGRVSYPAIVSGLESQPT